MKAEKKIQLLQYNLERRGLPLPFEAVASLRRAEFVLHRWCEGECGDDAGHIERDEVTNQPYRVHYNQYTGKEHRYRVADKETATLKRVEKLTQELGIHWYYQSDPRGCSIYVSKNPIDDSNYSSGYAICD